MEAEPCEGLEHLLACVFLCATVPVFAQEKSDLEVGTYLGVALTFANGETVTTFGVPGAGSFLGLAALYVTTFPHPNILMNVVPHPGSV